ncbi:MAG TPA: universal stress protein [Burkholderiales bacterium]|jgi:nucleotide-binding universal stress UspA family protein|nr:universal stress protein [Burkholderiales bacterium]
MKILLPVDGSARAHAAVRLVVAFFRAGVPLEARVLHVQPRFHRHIAQFTSRAARDALRAERSRAALAPALEALVRMRVPCSALSELGEPAERIAAVAARERADAIVMGSGRIADQVVARTDIAVTTVPEGRAGALERYALPAGLGALAALMWAAD